MHTYTHTNTKQSSKVLCSKPHALFCTSSLLCHLHKLSTQSMTFVFSFAPTQKQTVHKTSAGGWWRQWVAKKTTTTTTIFRQQVYLIPQQQHFYDNKFTSFSCQEKIQKIIIIIIKKIPMKLLPTSHLAHSFHT